MGIIRGASRLVLVKLQSLQELLVLIRLKSG